MSGRTAGPPPRRAHTRPVVGKVVPAPDRVVAPASSRPGILFPTRRIRPSTLVGHHPMPPKAADANIPGTAVTGTRPSTGRRRWRQSAAAAGRRRAAMLPSRQLGRSYAHGFHVARAPSWRRRMSHLHGRRHAGYDDADRGERLKPHVDRRMYGWTPVRRGCSTGDHHEAHADRGATPGRPGRRQSGGSAPRAGGILPSQAGCRAWLSLMASTLTGSVCKRSMHP
jgi:hypothetical protein